jgi:D-alanine-D-alanine ligase
MELVEYDVALSNLHGPYGEDGRLQGLLDYLRVPYCGSGVGASAVAADKILCKRVMLTFGVPTPGWHVWSGGPMTWNGRPVMVKPPFGGSSVGMSVVRDPADLPAALADAAGDEGAPVLVEEYVNGTPMTWGCWSCRVVWLLAPRRWSQRPARSTSTTPTRSSKWTPGAQ